MFIRHALVFAAVAAVTSGSVTMSKDEQPDCVPDRFYTVESGDTCDIISQKTGTPTFQLSHANPDIIDEECSNLYPGEVLCLGREGQDCRDVHTVQPGDTCSDIAEDAGTTLEILLANNPNVDLGCTNIYTGEVLCTADHEFDYTDVATD